VGNDLLHVSSVRPPSTRDPILPRREIPTKLAFLKFNPLVHNDGVGLLTLVLIFTNRRRYMINRGGRP
jgi:hypothetical protein